MTTHPSYSDLREWLARAEEIGELKHVRGAPLDPEELEAWLDRAVRLFLAGLNEILGQPPA